MKPFHPQGARRPTASPVPEWPSATPSRLFLLRHEVEELTGAKRKNKQREVLIRNGIRHTLNAAGWPVVPRSAIEAPLAPAHAPDAWSPTVLHRAS